MRPRSCAEFTVRDTASRYVGLSPMSHLDTHCVCVKDAVREGWPSQWQYTLHSVLAGHMSPCIFDAKTSLDLFESATEGLSCGPPPPDKSILMFYRLSFFVHVAFVWFIAAFDVHKWRSKSRPRVPHALNRPTADLIASAAVTGIGTGSPMRRRGGEQSRKYKCLKMKKTSNGSRDVMKSSTEEEGK